MKITYRHFINPHKALTPVFIISLIVIYGNAGVGPLVYLALHGTYCLNWFLKELIFPDQSFDKELSITDFVLATFAMYNYWWSPWILITNKIEPRSVTIFAAVFLNISGTFLHYCCDAQKYFMLQERKRLLTSGFFARSRNMNYLGEIMIYLGFAVMAEHIWPVAFLLIMVVFIFFPKMWEKDESISRYEEFAEYKKHSNLFIPKLTGTHL